MIVYAPAADRDVARFHDWLLERSPAAAAWFSLQLQSAERRIKKLERDGRQNRYPLLAIAL